MEINAAQLIKKKKKKKGWKAMKTLSYTSGEHYNTPIFEL